MTLPKISANETNEVLNDETQANELIKYCARKVALITGITGQVYCFFKL